MELVNGALVPRVRARPAEIDLDIDTWVEVLGAIFAAPLLIAAEAGVAAAEGMFERLIDQAVGQALAAVADQIQATLNTAVLSVGFGQPAVDRGGDQPVRHLGANAGDDAGGHRLNPILGIRLDQQVTDLGVVSSGTKPGRDLPRDTSYAYQDRHQWTTVTLTAMPQALGDQVAYAWTVNGDEVEPRKQRTIRAGQNLRRIRSARAGPDPADFEPQRCPAENQPFPTRRQPQPVRVLRRPKHLRPGGRSRRRIDHHRSPPTVRTQLRRGHVRVCATAGRPDRPRPRSLATRTRRPRGLAESPHPRPSRTPHQAANGQPSGRRPAEQPRPASHLRWRESAMAGADPTHSHRSGQPPPEATAAMSITRVVRP